MAEKKILSIDFDIIMYPCIKLYNNYVSGTANPTELWAGLNMDFNMDNFIRYDANVYHDLVMLILKNVRNGARLIPITEHQMIIDKLQAEGTYDEDEFNLTNIDFHHDLWYSDRDKINAADFEEWACNNWLGYLYLKDKIKNMHWVKAPNSELLAPADLEVFNTISGLSSIKELGDDYTDIYFCLSPQWVPYQYHHLYNLIIDIVKEG